METLELSRVCRLCGRQAGMTIDIFGKRGNHAKKINMVLPILVHEMDLLPKQICHPCNYKLQEFRQFYDDCLKTDADLKSQLSWMQRSKVREEIAVPMVQINNFKIKKEPLDYLEHDYTREILNKEKMTNYEENNYTDCREKFVKFSDTQCARCGYYRDDKNHDNDDFPKNCSKKMTKENNSSKKNDLEYSSRDSARRNLFATEIFENKNSRVQTEIPICNVSRRFLNDKSANGVYSLAGLNSLSDEKKAIVVEPKIEIAKISTTITPRTLRPRKDFVKTLTCSRSSKKTNEKLSSREIIEESRDKAKSSEFMEIKMEAPVYMERSLRPRMEAIDYSETKRKNPLARAPESERRVKKIKISSNDDYLCKKFESQIDKDPVLFVKNMDVKRAVSSSILVVKLERENIMECAKRHSNICKTNKIVKSSFESRNNNGKALNVVTREEIVNGNIKEKIITKKNVKNIVNRPESRVKRFNEKINVGSKRENCEKIFHKSTIRLRSKIGYLKNEKISRTNGDKTLSTIMKYQVCNNCEERFASQELYRLHDCYTNKSH